MMVSEMIGGGPICEVYTDFGISLWSSSVVRDEVAEGLGQFVF